MSTRRIAVFFLIDALLVLAFVLIGRTSHNEGVLGAFVTYWPFLTGLVLGWLLLRAWRSPRSLRFTGVGIWVSTAGLGLLLRLISGQGVQLSFVIVTISVLGIFLLGWRVTAGLVHRFRSRAAAPAPAPSQQY